MPQVVAKDIKMAHHNANEVSSLYVGTSLVWEHPSQVVIKTVDGTNIVVPSWAVAVSLALIGGGGGGQSGNGARGGDGRPGGGANWAVYYKNLERSEGQSFYINTTVGDGGAGGANSDHAAGSQGGSTSATLMRRAADGSLGVVGSYTAEGGLGGPASGRPVGSSSGIPTRVNAPRLVPPAPYELPRGATARYETVGGSPGAGGGYGQGGLFGRRGRGAAGGKGQARFYFYGAP